MPVNGVSNTQASSLAYVRNDVSASAVELTMTDFYQLLAAQLKYQDADNPMDTSQMMAQMVQTQMIQAITQMTNNNTTTYVASMVGKNVTVKEVDELGRPTGDVTKGDVTGVVLGTDPKIFINGKGYSTSQLIMIGDIPEDKQEGNKNNTGNKGNTGAQ